MVKSIRKLPRNFYMQPTLIVAKELLGKYLVRKINRKHLIGKIVEVEAYLDKNDPASHSYHGKTKRNEVMFWQGGHLYVYFTYGMHFCCNVVTEEEGKGCAVLIRAIEPVYNIETMRKLRNNCMVKNIHNLTNGPAKVCQALAIKKNENGIDLCGNKIWIGQLKHFQSKDFCLENNHIIISSKRIGISNGTAYKWRYYLKDNTWVSNYKRVNQ